MASFTILKIEKAADQNDSADPTRTIISVRPSVKVTTTFSLQVPVSLGNFDSIPLLKEHDPNLIQPQLVVKAYVPLRHGLRELVPSICTQHSRSEQWFLHTTASAELTSISLKWAALDDSTTKATGQFAVSFDCSLSHWKTEWDPRAPPSGYCIIATLYIPGIALVEVELPVAIEVIQRRASKRKAPKDPSLDAPSKRARTEEHANTTCTAASQSPQKELVVKAIQPNTGPITGGVDLKLILDEKPDPSTHYFVHFGFKGKSIEAFHCTSGLEKALTCPLPPSVGSKEQKAVVFVSTHKEIPPGYEVHGRVFHWVKPTTTPDASSSLPEGCSGQSENISSHLSDILDIVPSEETSTQVYAAPTSITDHTPNQSDPPAGQIPPTNPQIGLTPQEVDELWQWYRTARSFDMSMASTLEESRAIIEQVKASLFRLGLRRLPPLLHGINAQMIDSNRSLRLLQNSNVTLLPGWLFGLGVESLASTNYLASQLKTVSPWRAHQQGFLPAYLSNLVAVANHSAGAVHASVVSKASTWRLRIPTGVRCPSPMTSFKIGQLAHYSSQASPLPQDSGFNPQPPFAAGCPFVICGSTTNSWQRSHQSVNDILRKESPMYNHWKPSFTFTGYVHSSNYNAFRLRPSSILAKLQGFVHRIVAITL